jgi:hypothetical protein
MTRGFRGKVLLMAGVLALWANAAHAQAIGSIFGKVTDESGAVLPGVTVTVTGSGLQQPLVAQTSSGGTYQFPSVPIGTYTVTFELASFKKAVRQNVIVTTGFNAGIDQKLEVGALTEEVTVSGASPVVDLKETGTSTVFTLDILEKIPTVRDPWQIINMTPGVQAGLNVGGSSSGQQVGLRSRGTAASVQWNLEGGNITDLSSNSSPAYFNFDSFQEIQVQNGGGDVSVQSSGLFINLVTKSGSNVHKGSVVTTFENDKMQFRNVSEELFKQGTGGFLSGAPINRISNISGEFGGPILKNKLWFWGYANNEDINTGVVNFFDTAKGGDCATYAEAQRLGRLTSAITYDKLDEVARCLKNDKTVLKNLGWKINYQLNTSHKFQYLFQSDNKVRDSRGASSTTAREAVTQQYSDAPWKLPLPTHSINHTYVASDKLVFTNMFTYVHGGFFLDYQDFSACGESRWLNTTDYSKYVTGARSNPDCLWNQQALTLRTTGFESRSLGSSYETKRPGTEIKMDGTYFLTNRFGGDHSLKFGLGYRKNPVMSFNHFSGGARAHVQCVGNNAANCGNGQYVAVGSSATGLVPYQAVLSRDSVTNHTDWWTYNGYIQESFSRGRWRLNGGLRYDWQQSKFLGGCVPANQIRPDLLPGQCEDETDFDRIANQKLPAFNNWSPRVSATYDLFGNGKTSLKVSGSYYYATRIVLANALNGLGNVSLTWGPNQSSGACSTTANAPCWTDANRDGIAQANELIGVPTASTSRFNTTTGVLEPAGNQVDRSAKIARTREFITGAQHELMANLAVGVDYIYRQYDRGTATYPIGYQPGAPNFPLSQLYTGPLTHTDPVTGKSAPYFVVCNGCMRPSGVGNIQVTSVDYSDYHGVDITLTKRYSNKWQANVGVTIQNNPNYYPTGTTSTSLNSIGNGNPTGMEFLQGASTEAGYLIKASGSYEVPWGINVAANFVANQGGTRTQTINGPGAVYGGVNAAGAATTISYNTLRFEGADATRFEDNALLDIGIHKYINLGGTRRLKLMLDGFNILNAASILRYSSDNLSLATSRAPNNILPPRVFRVGASLNF